MELLSNVDVCFVSNLGITGISANCRVQLWCGNYSRVKESVLLSIKYSAI
jgi:hypothetical protein